MDATAALKVIIGILLVFGGSWVGLRRLLIMTIGFIGCYSSYAMTQAYFTPVSSHLATIVRPRNAIVITMLLLVLPPILVVFFFGRTFLIRIGVNEQIAVAIDRVLGAAYAFALYSTILYCFGGI